MNRLLMIVGGAVALAGCVSVPGAENMLVTWNNGVSINERPATYWEGVSSFERREDWARNDSDQVQCVGMSDRTKWIQLWTLPPRSNQPMWPEMGQYGNRFMPGLYGTWTATPEGACYRPPSDVQLVEL